MIPTELNPPKPRVTPALKILDSQLQCEDRNLIVYVLEDSALQLTAAKNEKRRREIMARVRLTGWYLRRAIDAEAQS